MEEVFAKLGGSIAGRPYVFVFLGAYLVVAGLQMGWRRAVAFIPVGYGIAWASEKLSITTGFPYGWYFYKYENLQTDLIVAGVPFFDSLSYVFLAYVGWSMAITLLLPLRRNGLDVRWSGHPHTRSGGATIFLGAFLTMLLDVVIDPIAHKGDEWFLGSIYNYGQAHAPQPGEYFDIALTNFLGWFLVAYAIIFVYATIDRALCVRETNGRIRHGDGTWNAGLLGVGLFYGVLAFNLVMMLVVAVQRATSTPPPAATFGDGAATMLVLFAISVAWHAPFAVALIFRIRRAG